MKREIIGIALTEVYSLYVLGKETMVLSKSKTTLNFFFVILSLFRRMSFGVPIENAFGSLCPLTIMSSFNIIWKTVDI